MGKSARTFSLVWLAGVVAFAAPPGARAEVTMEELAERMGQMEREIRELRRTVQEQQDTIDSQGDMWEERELMGVESAGEFAEGRYPHTTVGGYVDVEYLNFDNTDSDIDQHRFILNVSSQLHERIEFYSEIEFEHGVDTGAGGGSIEIEQAWVDFELYPWLVFRAGALLVPFGRYNLLHDSDMNDLTARPLYARRIVPTTWTEAGFGLNGDIVLPRDMAMNYEVYVVNGLDDGITDQGTRGARPALRRDNNNNKSVVGRVALTPVPWATIGAYGYTGRWTDSNADADSAPPLTTALDNERVHGYGFDVFARRGPWEVVGEYGMFDFANADALGPVGPGVILDGEMHGGYAQLAYHFWPAFLDNTPLGEPFEHPTLTAVGRYDYAEIELMSAEDNSQERWTIGMNYRPIETMVFKAEWQWNDHDGAGRDLENAGEQGFVGSVAWAF